MLGLSFSSKLDWRSYIMSLAKTTSRKLEPYSFYQVYFFFLLRLLCVSVNLPYGLAFDIVAISGLERLDATWEC